MSFPFVDEGPVTYAGPLPEAADLVVIGGGVIGVCTALFAARAGLRVVLVEKGRIAAEQSSRNWGWIRVQGRDPAEIPIALEAQALWHALDAECKGRMGVATVGVSYLGRAPRDLAGFEGWLNDVRDFGLSSRMLGRDATARLMNGASAPWVGALHTPSDMKAEPWVAVPELARLAVEAGATLVEHCAVRALDTGGGRVTGVATEAGRVSADQVVLAGGAWSALLLARHGVRIPQLSVRSTAVATGPLPQVFGGAAVDDRLAVRRRGDGGYTLAPAAFSELFVGPDAVRALPKYAALAVSGEFDVHLHTSAPKGFPDGWTTPRTWSEDAESPFERMRVLNPAPSAEKVSEITRRFAQLWPQIGGVPVQKAWAGMIDVLPDVVPVVDKVAQLPGLTVVTGMCGHGFGIGPAFGRIAADLVMGNAPGHDLSRFRLARFSDGSKLRPGPNI